MEMTIIDKIIIMFKYIFSSFMGIELLLLSLLLFIFTILNIKKNNKIVKIVSIILCLAFLLGLIVSYHNYALYCIDSFIKFLLSYIYFPSMVMYFFIMILVTIAIIVTIVSKKMSTSKKIVNSIVLSIMYLCFMCVASLAVTENLDLSVAGNLYKNETLLSFIQVSDLLFFFWFEYTLLYYFYKFLEYKLDKKSS